MEMINSKELEVMVVKIVEAARQLSPWSSYEDSKSETERTLLESPESIIIWFEDWLENDVPDDYKEMINNIIKEIGEFKKKNQYWYAKLTREQIKAIRCVLGYSTFLREELDSETRSIIWNFIFDHDKSLLGFDFKNEKSGVEEWWEKYRACINKLTEQVIRGY